MKTFRRVIGKLFELTLTALGALGLIAYGTLLGLAAIAAMKGFAR